MSDPHPLEATIADSPERIRETPAESATQPASLESGPVTVPGYAILAELGRGGMGVVYKAHHLKLNRVVALKMILAGRHAGPTELARFRQEAELVARLRHPNIIQIYEVGTHEGCTYLALEYVEGGNLAQKTAGLPQPPRDASRLVELLARAVESAHQSGILHRDLTPSNVLLTADGAPKLTDFGIARSLGNPQEMTATGAILGTPGYLAPEQARASKTDLSPATDVFGLGAILYYLLTGRPPFQAATTLDTVLQTIEREPVPPTQLQPKIPRDLEIICLKCLQKEPARRYPTAAALADDLHRFLVDEPIRARPVSHLERAWRWCRRNPRTAVLIATVALLLVFIAVGASVVAAMLRKERNRLQIANARLLQQYGQTVVERQRAEKAEGDLTEQLWQSMLREAQALRWSGRAGRRFDSLKALAEAARIARELEMPPARILQLRNEAIACLALADIGSPKVERDLPPGTAWLAVDAQLERYACADPQGNLSVRRLVDDQELVVLSAPAKLAVVPEFSPDGRYLAAQYQTLLGSRLHVWDLSNGKTALVVANGTMTLDFSPDGRLLAVQQQDGQLHLYDLTSGNEVQAPLALRQQAYRVRFHPHGRQLAVSIGSSVQVWNLDTAKSERILSHPHRVYGMAWRHDGGLLAAACADFRVYVWHLASGRSHQSVLEGHEAEVIDVAFSQGGDLLASHGWDDTIRVWNPLTGRELVTTPSTFNGPFVGNDRLRPFATSTSVPFMVTVGARRIAIREVAAGRECRVLHSRFEQGKGPWGMDFSPNGRLLASACDDGVRLWDVAFSQEIALLPVGESRSVVFHPTDGSLITFGRTSGLRRWPVKWETSGAVQLGPPHPLGVPADPLAERFCLSPDGRILAAVASRTGKVVVLDLEKGTSQTMASSHPGAAFVTTSPDGRWIATGTWYGVGGVKICDAQSGDLIKELLPESTFTSVAFSPDGRWLVCGTQSEYRFFEVGSWQLSHHIPGTGPHMSFSRGESLLALLPEPRQVRLLDPATCREFATLPGFGGVGALAFSHNGDQLAAGAGPHTIHVWNLRLIRQQLGDMGLDWDLPHYPPPPADDRRPSELLKIQVDLGDVLSRPAPSPRLSLLEDVEKYTARLKSDPDDVEAYHQRAHIYEKLGEYQKAIEDFTAALQRRPNVAHFYDARGKIHLKLKDAAKAAADFQKSLDLKPEQAELCNDLAWLLVAGPQELRDAQRAVPLAERAVKLAPDRSTYHNTLGVAYYRAGRYKEAVAALETSLRTSGGASDGFDLFFLAMCHQRLGDTAAAKQSFDRAIEWCSRREAQLPPEHQQELQAFRAEAEAVLTGKP